MLDDNTNHVQECQLLYSQEVRQKVLEATNSSKAR